MASGIRLETAEVLHVPVQGAIPEAWRTQAFPPITQEMPTAVGTLLVHQEVHPVSSGERVSVIVVSVGAVGVGAAGAGEVGASAWDGRTGAASGDRTGRSAGILGGGTTLIGMLR